MKLKSNSYDSVLIEKIVPLNKVLLHIKSNLTKDKNLFKEFSLLLKLCRDLVYMHIYIYIYIYIYILDR